jgi:hypothetical protein
MSARSLRRHHRVRRIAAVLRLHRTRLTFGAFKGNGESDEPNPGFVRMQARTRTLCSCWVCKGSRTERARRTEQELARRTREATVEVDPGAVFDDECDMDFFDDTEDDRRWHREQLDEWQRSLT